MQRILLVLITIPLLFAQNPAITVNIDVNANRHPINPLIYGVNFGDATTLADLNAPLNRMGGNNTSRYNWQLNADNKDQDWYFQSIGDTSATPGERGDTFFSASKSAGAQPMITIPMLSWVAKLGANRSKLASFSIAKYGAQTGSDWQWFPDAGNGILNSGQYVAGNDPNDANVPSDSSFQQQWVNHLMKNWGTAASGGVKYYIVDNEHSIWFSTHRDVHPVGPTGAEIRDKILDYSARIKASDPSALIVGPEEWGWSGYLLSGYDQQYGLLHGWSYLPDRATAMSGMDYLPWLLSQWKNAGKKPIDVFSVHCYPQGADGSNDTSTATQLLRNQSTRQLWDPNYVDQSWIADKVYLIPRMKQWVQTYYYAGTPTAITEYNWGAESHINGATAQADILGIFGREGLDMATRWTIPAATTPTYKAMKIYRNYDGNKNGFGDTSVSTVTPNPDNLAAFSAIRSSDGALTTMVINKLLSSSTAVTLNLAGFAAGTAAQAWQVTAANTITRIADVTLAGSALTATLPAQSITLFVIPVSTANKPPVASATAAPLSGTAPLAVSFDGSASSDPDGTISSYAWAFGDGATGTGAKVSHTYAAGTYTAKLTVTDNLGASASTTITITAGAAPNKPPAASATATPVSGTAPLAVSFDGSASSDPDGTISSYAWAFGDGATGTGAKVSHTYAAGTFTAKLTVTDNQGATAFTTKTITANAPPPSACTVSYSVTNDWGNGFQAEVSITNNTQTAINGWSLTWSFAGNQRVYDLWNGKVSQSGKTVTVKNETWNPKLAGGATLNGIGFNATYSGSNQKPTAFALNGKPCTSK